MHPVLEQIKQFLAPRWYKLQKSVVEFVKQFLVPKLRELQKYMVKFAKQFLVPKWHELQKYMVEFKERMTMKRMVVMCLLLVAVVCGSPSHMGFDAVAQRGVIFELDVLEQCVEAVGRMYYPYGFVAGAGVFFQNCRVDGEASEFVVGDVFAGQETEACVGFRAFV